MTTVSDVYRLLDLILKIPPEILKHQRIGQILTNAADDIDLYYFSNDELLGLLEKYVNTLRKDATMNLREELERLDDAVITGASYGIDQSIWRRMIGVLDHVDALGLAIAEAGYTWTPAMRSAYERATETVDGVREGK